MRSIRIGSAVGVVALAMTPLVAAPATAAELTEEYQLCTHKSNGWNVCIEKHPNGWHGRGWGPASAFTSLYNNGKFLVSVSTPPGGNNQTTGGFPAATKACISSGPSSGVFYACVDIKA